MAREATRSLTTQVYLRLPVRCFQWLRPGGETTAPIRTLKAPVKLLENTKYRAQKPVFLRAKRHSREVGGAIKNIAKNAPPHHASPPPLSLAYFSVDRRTTALWLKALWAFYLFLAGSTPRCDQCLSNETRSRDETPITALRTLPALP